MATATTAVKNTPISATKKRKSTSRVRKAHAFTVIPNQEAATKPMTTTSPSLLDIEDFSPSDAHGIRASLLPWYDHHKRDLPWRKSRSGPYDPHCGTNDEDHAYAVWVSEVMLQQTRVAAVVSYYNRWMNRWPTVAALAGATQEEVNEMWAGLGYYRRARFLLEGAKSIVERREFPKTASGLRKVKGIGDYTAGAIASIAFNEVVPVVDGNVVRVIARLKAISSNPKESSTVKTIWKLAGQLVDPSRSGDFNQALMELGATLCSVTSPSCSKCPISSHCHAFSLSKNSQSVMVTDFPVKVSKPKQRLDFAAVSVVEIEQSLKPKHFGDGDTSPVFLLVKRPDEGLLAGLWEFPSVLIDGKNLDQEARRTAIDQYLKTSFSIDVETNWSVIFRQDVGEYIHVFSHIRLHMYVELLVVSPKGVSAPPQERIERELITWKYVDKESIKTMGLTSGIRKVYSMIENFKKEGNSSSHPKSASRKRSKAVLQ